MGGALNGAHRPPARTPRAALLRPFAGWPRPDAASLRPDLNAALLGAVVAVPQAIALAALAGLPPRYGLYASVLPVMVAAVWGSARHLVSGPNTAVSLMLAAAIAPLAPDPAVYVSLVVLVTALVGAVQLAVGLLRLGSLLDFVSGTVIVGVVHAVALVMIVSSLAGLAGAEGAGFAARLRALPGALAGADHAALAVGAVTVAAGLLARRWWRRHALLIALAAGSLAVPLWAALAGATPPDLPRLALAGMGPLPFAAPALPGAPLPAAARLAGDVLAIAFVGLMQSVLIARSLAQHGGERVDADRECVGQGCANLTAALVSGFAGSGSFNRSALQRQLGARTPWSILLAALLLWVLVVGLGPLLAQVPQAAVAGLLVLVGLGQLDGAALRRLLRSREEGPILAVTLAGALALGLPQGVLAGVLLSLAIYLRRTAVPRIAVSRRHARDGGTLWQVDLDGNLFFGSVPALAQALPAPPAPEPPQRLLIRTGHLTYLDAPGAEALLRQVRRWRDAGHGAWVQVGRPELLAPFEDTGLLAATGRDCLIRPDRPHVVKALLDPGGPPAPAPAPPPPATATKEEPTVQALAQRLHALPLLGPIPIARLRALLESQPVLSAEAGDIIVRSDDARDDHLVLLEGAVEAQRVWTSGGGYDKSHTWTVRPDAGDGRPGLISAASRRLRVRALSDIRYLRLDADGIDALLGWNWAEVGGDGEDPAAARVRQRMGLVRQVGVFHHLPLERVPEAFARMEPLTVDTGQAVVREGEKGDRYYVIEEGEAEVIRSDPFSGETRVVDHMGAGDGFGEESLLQDGYRNATVRMLTPGRLLCLGRDDFERLIRPAMVEEIDAEAARDLLAAGEAQLIDCRYDLEYEESRIPGGRLMPLHELRFHAHELDPDGRYIVYCRSGRRSRAAAFLLRERNLSAVSLRGGIRDWPWAVDTTPPAAAQGSPA